MRSIIENERRGVGGRVIESAWREDRKAVAAEAIDGTIIINGTSKKESDSTLMRRGKAGKHQLYFRLMNNAMFRSFLEYQFELSIVPFLTNLKKIHEYRPLMNSEI